MILDDDVGNLVGEVLSQCLLRRSLPPNSGIDHSGSPIDIGDCALGPLCAGGEACHRRIFAVGSFGL